MDNRQAFLSVVNAMSASWPVCCLATNHYYLVVFDIIVWLMPVAKSPSNFFFQTNIQSHIIYVVNGHYWQLTSHDNTCLSDEPLFLSPFNVIVCECAEIEIK